MSPLTPTDAGRDEVWSTFARHVSAGKARFLEQAGYDPVFGEREGIWVNDAYDDRRWIDCHVNGGVFNLGHRPPAVLAALHRALEHLDIGNHHHVSPWRAELARRLSATTGHRLDHVVFAVGGGEAADLALKVARGHTGRREVVSARGGYHGHVGLALAAGDARWREPFGASLPGFHQVPFDDLEALDAVVGEDTAAVILEPIPATLGMPLPSPGYLEGVQRLCRARGALLVVDEIQTGLGRTGRMWAYQHEGLEPDLLLTGKGLSGGLYPIAATLMTAEVHGVFDRDPFAHISTFGGSELGCATALAVLDATEAPGFLERVEAVGRRLEAGLAGLPVTLRRRGLMMGLKTGDAEGGLLLARRLFDAGVLAPFAANDPSVVQFLPPLIISDEEADALTARVRQALS